MKSGTSKGELRERIIEEVEAHRAELVDLSLRIHSHPELGLAEKKS